MRIELNKIQNLIEKNIYIRSPKSSQVCHNVAILIGQVIYAMHSG